MAIIRNLLKSKRVKDPGNVANIEVNTTYSHIREVVLRKKGASYIVVRDFASKEVRDADENNSLFPDTLVPIDYPKKLNTKPYKLLKDALRAAGEIVEDDAEIVIK